MIISIIIITLWLLVYATYVSKELSDSVKLKDMLITVLFGSVFPFIYVINLMLKLTSKVQIVYYVTVVSEEISKDCE